MKKGETDEAHNANKTDKTIYTKFWSRSRRKENTSKI